MPKVSVIMPVYKVEKYLESSIKSVLNQTFTDFELILVDDGSPDKCPQICDDYAKRHKNIVAVHKQNGGISSARNAGIEKAVGKYILFIDSDDTIMPETLEKTICKAEETDADIVCFGFEMVDENLEPLSWGHTKENSIEVFSNDKCMLPLLPPYDFGDYTWNKLYKKALFSNVEYPEGLIFEDTYTTYKVFANAKRTVSIPDHLYFYRRHKNSITTKGGLKSHRNYFSAVKQKYAFISNNYSDLSDNAAAGLVNSFAAILFQIPTKNISNEYKHLLSDIRLFLIENKNIIDYNTLSSTDNIDICKKLMHGIIRYKNYRKQKNIKRKIDGIIYSLPEKAMLFKRKIAGKK